MAIVLRLWGRFEATRFSLGTDTLADGFHAVAARRDARSRRIRPTYAALWGNALPDRRVGKPESTPPPRPKRGTVAQAQGPPAVPGAAVGPRQRGRRRALVRQQRRRPKKGPAALALVAGAAGVAVVKRRRSAAANEPTGEGLAGGEHDTGAQTARADRPAQEPPTAPEPDAERESEASGGGSSKSKGGLE
jgi:hypothetical protein